MARSHRRNDLVRIGKNSRVYRIATVDTPTGVRMFYLKADADHPDAAKRVADAWRWFGEDELSRVS